MDGATEDECCSDCYESSVSVYCSRFYPDPLHTVPIRAFTGSDDLSRFVPIFYGHYESNGLTNSDGGALNSLCYNSIGSFTTMIRDEFADQICEKLGFVATANSLTVDSLLDDYIDSTV